jgi:endonuclease/exonuclease/phosphatase (EEP) superfamily protein YafD
MRSALFGIGLALIFLTVLTRVRSAKGWIRVADFPRLQVAIGLALVIAAFAFHGDPGNPWDAGFGLALVGSLLYQCSRILPYTRFFPTQVAEASGDGKPSIKILIANVLMENRRAGDLIALIGETNPDLVLTLETDAWWDGALRVLQADYPHSVAKPLDNLYGIHLFSKLELVNPQLRYLVDDEIPSIHTGVKLASGAEIDFHGIHPRPPLPQQGTEQRDAELLIVGRAVKGNSQPTIVAGDLNDVAWSHTTRLFQRISGLLDPRRGRGFFSTFHADLPGFRWPLDHVFHDRCFRLVRLRRLGHIGSDHLPVLVELQLDRSAGANQAPPPATSDDKEEARERIAEGRDAAVPP